MDDRLISIEQTLTALQASGDALHAEFRRLQASNDVIRVDLAKLQVAIDSFAERYATKADLEMVKTAVSDAKIEFYKAMQAQTWKLISWMTVVCSALTTAVYFIARNVR
jgi:maltooligosyltrehalose synthase